MNRAINEAVIAIKSGNQAKGHKILMEVLKRDPKNIPAWLWLAEINPDPLSKRDSYMRVLQLDPRNEIALAHIRILDQQKPMSNMPPTSYRGVNHSSVPRQATMKETQVKHSRSNDNKPVLTAILVFLMLVGIGVGAYFLLKSRGVFDKQVMQDLQPQTGLDLSTTTQTAPLFIIEDTPTPTREPSVFVPTNPVPDPMNLVQNGYFLEDFDGWERELKDEGGSSKAAIEDSTNSLFNRMLSISQEGKGFVAFSQNIPISNPDLEFSCKVYTKATEGNIPFFSGSGYSIIVLSYRDHNNEQIGFTRYLNVNESLFAGTAFVGAPDAISDTNTVHNIRVSSGEQVDIYLKVKDEINSNLLGIDIGDVKYISIVIIAGSQDEGAKGIVRISDIVLKER